MRKEKNIVEEYGFNLRIHQKLQQELKDKKESVEETIKSAG